MSRTVELATSTRYNNIVQLFFEEEVVLVININDTDMSSKTLAFNIEKSDRINIVSIPDASIQKTITNISVNIDGSVTNKLGTYLWSLRDLTSGDTVLSSGIINVSRAQP